MSEDKLEILPTNFEERLKTRTYSGWVHYNLRVIDIVPLTSVPNKMVMASSTRVRYSVWAFSTICLAFLKHS